MALIKIAILLGLVVIFPVLVIATGSTFGQRCKSAGLTGLDYERWIYDLSHGYRP